MYETLLFKNLKNCPEYFQKAFMALHDKKEFNFGLYRVFLDCTEPFYYDLCLKRLKSNMIIICS